MEYRPQRYPGAGTGDGVTEPAAAKPHNAFAGVEQGLCGDPADRYHNPGFDQGDVSFDEGQANGDLGIGGIAVSGRAPGQDVGDVDIPPIEADRRQHTVQKPPSRADEGHALAILLRARRLADEHQRRLRRAVGENEIGRRLLQRAAVECLESRPQRQKIACRGGDLLRARRRGCGCGPPRWRIGRIGRLPILTRGGGCGGEAVQRRLGDCFVRAGFHLPREHCCDRLANGHTPP